MFNEICHKCEHPDNCIQRCACLRQDVETAFGELDDPDFDENFENDTALADDEAGFKGDENTNEELLKMFKNNGFLNL